MKFVSAAVLSLACIESSTHAFVGSKAAFRPAAAANTQLSASKNAAWAGPAAAAVAGMTVASGMAGAIDVPMAAQPAAIEVTQGKPKIFDVTYKKIENRDRVTILMPTFLLFLPHHLNSVSSNIMFIPY
jgi:hypothetical protein